MMNFALRVEGLGKRYRLGGLQTYQTLRDIIAGSLFGKINADGQTKAFWALRDISFELTQGEVLGIIGRNGAGKSTLLKLLSRITSPDEGRIEISGRVGSLLEVGTGFHPELTGRENIFMNGVLLGMSHREVQRKFDEIVAFSGVEGFLETPVKRYSSGMRVRLGFAVAAHLDPEILIVDEVLAVGDAEFQRKCLGRMNEVASEGRTVLFVSHQMDAIASLCSRAIWLDSGTIAADGNTRTTIQQYLNAVAASAQIHILDRSDHIGHGPIRVTSIDIHASSGRAQNHVVTSGEHVLISVGYTNTLPNQDLGAISVTLAIRDDQDRHLATLTSTTQADVVKSLPAVGYLNCSIPDLPLMPGVYYLDYSIRVFGEVSSKLMRAFSFQVVEGGFNQSRPIIKDSAMFLVKHKWDFESKGI